MALFKYLKPISSDSSRQDSVAVSQPCKMVCLVPDKGNPGDRSRSEYIKLSLEKKSRNREENGVAKTVRHYKDLNIKTAV